MVKKIAITGPESTGKSSLSRALATHYGCDFVPEFAREYIQKLERPYTREDILVIARQQIALEESALKNARGNFLFCDTDLLVTKVWSMHKYDTCDPWILQQLEIPRYDLYLLCNVDLPWQYDDQREHPHLRNFFFEWYKRELEGYGFPYRIVSGSRQDRTENALALITDYFTLSHDAD